MVEMNQLSLSQFKRGLLIPGACLMGLGVLGVVYDTVHRVLLSGYAEEWQITSQGATSPIVLELLPDSARDQICTDVSLSTVRCSYRRSLSYIQAEPLAGGIWTTLAAASLLAFIVGVFRTVRGRRFGQIAMWAGAGTNVAWSALFFWGNPWGSYERFVLASLMLVGAATFVSLSTFFSGATPSSEA